jgi:hypothetical protein
MNSETIDIENKAVEEFLSGFLIDEKSDNQVVGKESQTEKEDSIKEVTVNEKSDNLFGRIFGTGSPTEKEDSTKEEDEEVKEEEKGLKSICIWECSWRIREEEEFEQRLREYRAELKKGIIVEGRRIGNIKMCERIKEGRSELEIKEELEGTKEAKYKKIKISL